MQTFHSYPAEVQTELRRLNNQGFGFLSEEGTARVAEIAPRMPLLVRCGQGGRITTAARDVAHFVAIIEREGSDYIRDVCFLAGTMPRPEVQR